VSPEPKRRSRAAPRKGRQREQVERGSNASYWPRRMDPAPRIVLIADIGEGARCVAAEVT